MIPPSKTEMENRQMKRFTSLLLAAVMLLSTTAMAQDAAKEELLKEMAAEARSMVGFVGMEFNRYNEPVAPADFSVMPAKFDLRDRGVVPPVRNQGNWGTCWGFSIIGASEISLLSEIGMTDEEYAQYAGEALDLSEKHLAWFGNGRLPRLEDYPEGEYIYAGAETQAGEGNVNLNEEEVGMNARYNNGGFMAYASGLFANGMGPTLEKDYPYQAADGTDSTAGDWSLPEEARFAQGAELENSAILPSPAQKDAEGRYVYNEMGTYAIKRELLNGRGVTIAYHADQAMNPDAYARLYMDEFESFGLPCTLDEVKEYLAWGNYEKQTEELSDDGLRLIYRLYIFLGRIEQEEDEGTDLTDAVVRLGREEMIAAINIAVDNLQLSTADGQEEAQEQAGKNREAIARAKAQELGMDYEEIRAFFDKTAEADAQTYINTESYAQYTDNVFASISHAVVIVGWDDNYSAENFIEGKQPPADGAWIVRNSWGESYGNEGYFYLSYYDQTIAAPETFDFVTRYAAGQPRQVSMSAWDFMPVMVYSSVNMEHPVRSANVLDMNAQESVLRYISVLTADLNVEVTADVYLLHEGAVAPDDGVLLDRVVKEFEYGGYHRLELNHDFLLPGGASIGVVVTQRAANRDGSVYALPYPISQNEKFVETSNIFLPEGQPNGNVYAVGCVGRGESYVKVGDAWIDWADMLQEHRQDSEAAEYLSFDNFGIKAYSYRLDELNSMHSFDQCVNFNGAMMHLCSGCSYAYVEQK